jgi:hypothetical protein
MSQSVHIVQPLTEVKHRDLQATLTSIVRELKDLKRDPAASIVKIKGLINFNIYRTRRSYLEGKLYSRAPPDSAHPREQRIGSTNLTL